MYFESEANFMNAPIMNVSGLNLVVSNADQDIDSACLPSENEFGETPLAHAPSIQLANGERAVPQQFLDVNRQLDNLCNVLTEISLPNSYQLFAGQEGSCLYLIVGVIGHENYAGYKASVLDDKIVYGRRWLIEPSTPTSEIVQTAMLAVKKVREHEARELFTVRINKGRNIATPFNCHLDLPLMAANEGELISVDRTKAGDVENLLARVRFAGFRFTVVNVHLLSNSRLFELKLEGQSRHFPELCGEIIAVNCCKENTGDFLHQLISELIHKSDRHIEESIRFKDFARFSRDIDPIDLAKFSYATRNIKATDPRFDRNFEDMSYKVDAAKAPAYNTGVLGEKQRATIASVNGLLGYLPRESYG